MKKSKMFRTRAMVVTAIMSALGYILMMFEFAVPFMPGFIKFDFSELPAVITAFTFGPVYGIGVCLFKNIIHLLNTTTAGVGELSNFILGSAFVFIAGCIYTKKKTFKMAVIGTLLGVVVMGVMSVFSNYFFVYPFYISFFGLPLEAIMGMYNAILPGTDSLIEALIIFNLPFTILKGLADAVICFLFYKKLSPILKGNNNY